MNAPKLAKHLFLITAYSWAYIGCYSEVTVKSDNCSEYLTETATVKTTEGQLYRLESPWAMDSLQNVYGKGEVLVEDDWRSFDGIISGSEIEQVTVDALDGNRTGVLVVIGFSVAVTAAYYLVQFAGSKPG